MPIPHAHPACAVERLDGEADAAAAFAQLLGDEPRELNARLAQERGKPARDGRRADRRPFRDEHELRALGHGGAPYARAR
jgi:hypothetical protein